MRELFLSGKGNIKKILLVISMTIILTANYMCNFMDVQNTVVFKDFQADSEALVTGMILADCLGIGTMEYGLGRYHDISGPLMSQYGTTYLYLTDVNWTSGYANCAPQILLNNNYYTRLYAIEGNYIRFSNGETIPIVANMENDIYLVVTLKSDQPLNISQYGSLSEIIILDKDGKELPKAAVEIYKSQYGLQGKIFRFIANNLKSEVQTGDNEVFHLFCSMITAGVLVMIVWLIKKKYDNLFAICYYITFLLSPWIVNFAKNLYWVEFTWFIPMLFGLFCSIYIDNRKCRMISYVGIFISITIKCLCGYEYISTIMLGMFSFLLVDFIRILMIDNDKKKAGLLFRTMIITGCCALIGFVSAVALHAYYRGEGDIWQGIQYIIQQDAIRRTKGIDDSISVLPVLVKYFQFSTEIITGVSGNLFVLFCLIPVCIFIYNYQIKTINWNDVILYFVFFVTTISWYCLAKNHAYFHTHMNYVLWYFGYIQLCIYVMVKGFIKLCNNDFVYNSQNI